MTMKQTPMQDLATIAADAHRAGNVDRRTFLSVCALAGIAPSVLLDQRAMAASNEIVFAGYGGDAASNMAEIFAKPFTAGTGTSVVYDGSGPTEGAIRAMVDTGQISWDIVDAENFMVVRLGEAGVFRPIDYSVVDRSKVLDGYALDCGIPGYFFSYVLAYDTEKLGMGVQPSWADFWDVQKYPGRRALWKWMHGALEAALLADGVAPEQLYPMDIERALNKILAIKDHLIFWDSGASAQQMFISGEVVMASIWNTRASILERDTSGRVTWTWDKGVLASGNYAVMNNNPAGDRAFEFIAFMQDPQLQVDYLIAQGGGPSNPASFDLLADDLKRLNPLQPENYRVQVAQDKDWWAAHYDEALTRYLEAISA